MENLNHFKPIIIVVGGTYGSESKGLVVGHLALEHRADYAVRTGSINAGHTVYYKGKEYVNQLLPVAWVNPTTQLVLGAGTYIEPTILEREIKMINDAMGDGTDVRGRLFIDFRCGIHTDEHKHKEEDKQLHQKMGSTGKGCSEAIIDKMARNTDGHSLFSVVTGGKGYNFIDTASLLNNAYHEQKQIIIEGTQGTLLDFHFGHYPYVTSRQTIANAWLTEAGFPPGVCTTVVSVNRVYPIRVAGNSGYMGKEMRWVDLARTINQRLGAYGKQPLVQESALVLFEEKEKALLQQYGFNEPIEFFTQEKRKKHATVMSNFHKEVLDSLDAETVAELRKLFELTTVTKKLRRIAELDIDELRYSNMLNNPSYLVMNFLNYKFPSCSGARTASELEACSEWKEISEYLMNLSEQLKVCIAYVNCSKDCIIKLNSAYGVPYLKQE